MFQHPESEATGYSSVDTTDEDVVRAAKAALKDFKEQPNGVHANLQLGQIIKAEEQIVLGVSIKLKFEAHVKDAPVYSCGAVVLKGLENDTIFVTQVDCRQNLTFVGTHTLQKNCSSPHEHTLRPSNHNPDSVVQHNTAILPQIIICLYAVPWPPYNEYQLPQNNGYCYLWNNPSGVYGNLMSSP